MSKKMSDKMNKKMLHRSLIQRVFGICATKPPADTDCFQFENDMVVLDLAKAPELKTQDSAIRLEGKNLPERILVVNGSDGKYHAFINKCSHMGRRLDPIPGETRVQCCSVGNSTFDYSGKLLSGSAKKEIKISDIRQENGKLMIRLD